MRSNANTSVPRVAILAALPLELAPLAARLKLRAQPAGGYEGRFMGAEVLGRAGGMGPARAEAAYRALLSEFQPAFTLVVGLAGAIDKALPPGAVFVPDRLVGSYGQAVVLEGDRPRLAGVPRGVPDADTARRTLLTVEQVAATAESKHRLGRQHGAAAVDMESYAVAKLAAERGERLRVVRAISDGHDEAPPVWAAALMDPAGQPRKLAAAGHVLTHPWHLPALLRMKSTAQTAAFALAQAAERELRAWLQAHPVEARR